MKVSVKKLSTNSSTYDTPLPEIDEMPEVPRMGSPLFLLSSSHTSGGILTSNVKEIIFKDDIYTVFTLNSIYEIKLLKFYN